MASSVRVVDAANKDTVEIGRLSARLAFAPLLRGALQFRELRLEDAAGAVTLSAPDGAPANPEVSAAQPAEPAPQEDFQVHIEGVEVVNSALTLRDADGAVLVDFADMDLRGRVLGRGAYLVTGALSADGIPLALDVRLNPGGAPGVLAGTLTARLVGAEAAFVANGRFGIGARTFAGDLSFSGEEAHRALVILGVAAAERPALMKPFSLMAKAAADDTGIALDGLTLDVGGAAAKGALEWRTARTPQLTTSLDFAPFAVEDWFAPDAVAAVAPAPTSSAPAQVNGGLNASAQIALRFPALTLRGQGLRDGQISASLAGNELKISDLALTLPGSTRVSGFGLVNIAAETPTLDGVISLQTFDARGFFSWLGADVTSVPSGRLGSASLQAALQGTLNFMELNDIEASVDTARVAGRLSFAPRARPFVGVDLQIDNVNLDSYRGTSPVVVSAAAGAAKPEVYGVTPSGLSYAGLGAFDAEVHVQVNGLTAGGLPGGRVGLDLGLKDGTLEIRTASFEKVAGTTAWFSGAVGGFGSALRFDNLRFDLAGDDIARLAAVTGLDLAPAVKALGGASLTGSLNGGAMQADLNAALKAADLTVRAAGQVMDITTTPRFTGQIDAAHPRFSDLMRTLPHGWPANMRDPGALALAVNIAQEPGKTIVRDARLTIGRDKVTGAAEIAKVDGRTHVTANLTDIAFDLDRILPRDASQVAPPPRSGAPSAAPSAWSQDEVTWSFLVGWSGEISAAGSAFSARGLALQDFSARFAVADGAAELAEWQGKIFGAPGQLAFRMAALPVPSLQGQLTVNRADFRAVVNAINGGRSTLKSGGTADMTLGVSTQGASVADLIGGLSGTGTLKVTASETGGGLAAGLLGPLSAAAQLDVATPGKPAPISFTARLTAAQGIVKLDEADVSSRSHTGRFTGAFDLPHRQVDVSGTLTPRKAGEDRLPISIKGAMERPNIRLLPPS